MDAEFLRIDSAKLSQQRPAGLRVIPEAWDSGVQDYNVPFFVETKTVLKTTLGGFQHNAEDKFQTIGDHSIIICFRFLRGKLFST